MQSEKGKDTSEQATGLDFAEGDPRGLPEITADLAGDREGLPYGRFMKIGRNLGTVS